MTGKPQKLANAANDGSIFFPLLLRKLVVEHLPAHHWLQGRTEEVDSDMTVLEGCSKGRLACFKVIPGGNISSSNRQWEEAAESGKGHIMEPIVFYPLPPWRPF